MKLLLIVVVIIGLAAVIGAVVVGKYSFDGTVVEKPYETGIAWDETRKVREGSGWKVEVLNASFIQGKNRLRISLSGREGKPLPDAEVSVKTARPATAAYDQRYPMSGDSGGIFFADISLVQFGHWDLSFEVKQGGKVISFGKRIFAEKADQP